MSSTFTKTFTYTDAKYLASKVAADLRQVSILYGDPPKEHVEKLIEEFTSLLKDGYLESVDYGFRKDGKWVFALSYKISSDGAISRDDNSGRIIPSQDVKGALWYSYLRYSSKFRALGSTEMATVKSALPFQRSEAPEPETGMWNYWLEEKVYSSSGTLVNRRRLESWL